MGTDAGRVRRAAKVDANHGAITEALRKVGWMVIDMSAVGRGIPDLWACKAGRALWIEIKDGSKPPSRQALTEAQERFHAKCKAHQVEIVTVTSVDDAVRL
jgi:Holliday junction resolvase